MAFDIYIDSTGDLDKSIRDQYGIDYCPMAVSIEGGKSIVASLDYDQGYSVHDFYEIMRNGQRIYTTQVSEQTFREKFEKSLSEGRDVLYIACSSALSASVKAAAKLSPELEAKYPGRKVIAFDALISGLAQGDMAIRASKMRAEGKSLDEVVDYLTKNRLKWNQFGTTENLTFLKKAGRVTASSAFFGNMFSVKPIIISDVHGHNYAVMKTKGRKASLIKCADLAVEASDDPANDTFYVAHADDAEAAELVKKEILAKVPNAHLVEGFVGPIIGASTGPGTIIVYSFGKEVTVAGE